MFLLLPLVWTNVCFAQEDFWGNTLQDGDEIHILDHDKCKGEYIEEGNYIRFENGNYEAAEDYDIEKY